MNQKVIVTIIIVIILVFGIYLAVVSMNDNGDGEDEESKSNWYSNALKSFQGKYDEIKIAVVYHEYMEAETNDWVDLRIDSSPESLKAYQNGIDFVYFSGKEGLPDLSNATDFSPLTEGCYLGFFPGWGELEDDVDAQAISDFEELSGRSVAFVPFSNFWGEQIISADQLEAIDSYGAVPMLRLMPWGEPYWDPPGYQHAYALQIVLKGTYNTFIKNWALEIKEYGKLVFITFGPEMNGDWFAWSGVYQGGSATDEYGDPNVADGPERYVDAYQHVVDIFEANGADNVVWYWQPNHESHPVRDWNNIDAYYPGDEYVDWVAFSLYGAQSSTDPWVGFDEVMEPIYNELTMKYSKKPLMLAEWGVREA